MAGAGAGPGQTSPIVNGPPKGGKVISDRHVMVFGSWINGKGYIVRVPSKIVE